MTVYTNNNTRTRAKEKPDMWKILFHLSHFLEKFMTRTVTRTECVKL